MLKQCAFHRTKKKDTYRIGKLIQEQKKKKSPSHHSVRGQNN